MTRSSRGREAVYATVLGALGILTRIPFRSHVLYHWDSVNFALALEHFDIRIHQPQPPGYVLYILLGRAFNLMFGDPNESLVWISVLFSGLTVAALFWLGRVLFGWRTGLVAALLALTSPLFWFHGEVALSYIIEGFFVTVIALCCYKQLTGDERYFVPASLALGIAGGFRQNTLVLLLPLWLFSLYKLRWRRRVAAVLVLVLTVAAWLAAMAYLSGGVVNYWLAVSMQSQGNLTISAAGPGSSLLINVVRLTVYGLYAVTIGLPIMFFSLLASVRQWGEWIRSPAWQILLVWMATSLAFYVFFVQQAGYSFTFMPGVLIILGYLVAEEIPKKLAHWKQGAHWSKMGLITILALNIVFYFAAPPFLLGQKKQLLNTPSWPAIHSRDVIAEEKLGYIRGHFPPESTAVLASKFDDRLPDFYLRDYRAPFLSSLIDESGEVILDDVRTLVLFSDEINIAEDSQGVCQEVLLACGEKLRWLERSEGQVFVLSASDVRMRGSNQAETE